MKEAALCGTRPMLYPNTVYPGFRHRSFQTLPPGKIFNWKYMGLHLRCNTGKPRALLSYTVLLSERGCDRLKEEFLPEFAMY